MTKFTLKLYITGETPSAQRAISNLSQICREGFEDDYRIIIIDVLERPQLAEDEKILATPTLVREMPPPTRRIIGDLSDREKVKALLGFDLKTPAGNEER